MRKIAIVTCLAAALVLGIVAGRRLGPRRLELRITAADGSHKVIGPLAEKALTIGPRRVRLGWTPGDPSAADFERLARNLARLAGAPDRDLVLALLPFREEGIPFLATGAGIVAASGPSPDWPIELRAARWRSLGEVMADAWIGNRPAAGPAAATGQQRWVRAALPGFLADRSLPLALPAGEGETERLDLLLTSLDHAALPRLLALSGAPRRESALLQQSIGPLALAEADRRFRATGGKAAVWLKPLLETGSLPPEIALAGDRFPAAGEIAELGPDRIRRLEVLTPEQAVHLPEPAGSGAGLPRSRVAWGSPDGSAVPSRLPDLLLLVWGEGQGHVENCGCVVNQSGGVARRRTAVRATRKLGVPTVTIDLGGTLAPAPRGREEPLLRRETEMYASSLDAAGLDVWVAGVEELSRGTDRLAQLAARAGARPISATATWAGSEKAGDLPASRMIRAGGAPVAIVGLTGPSRVADRTSLAVTAPTARIAWPAEARAAVDRETAAAASRSSLVIVAGQILEPEARRLAASGRVDLVLTSVGVPVPIDPGKPRPGKDGRLLTLDRASDGFAGRGAVIHAAIGSMGLYRISLWLKHPGIAALAVEEIFLDDRVPADPEMAARVRDFYRKIAADPALRNAGRPPLAALAAERDPARSYSGSRACLDCHLDESVQWAGTAHARALSTLRRRHRHFDPTCVSCHVVGYADRKGGYRIGEPGTHEVEDVGCETCHGPGSAHIAAKGDHRLIRGNPGPDVCVSCHHGQHDPGFQAAVAERFTHVRHRPATGSTG